jgi:hypothetical protein
MNNPTQEVVSNIDPQIHISPVVPETKSVNNLPVIILSVLVFVLFLAVGILGYQNIQLRKQIVAIPATTPDVKADWKTYQHSGCGGYQSMPFSVKIPSDWTETVSGGSDKFFTNYTYQNKDTFFKITCGSGFGGGGCGLSYPSIQDSITVNGSQTGACMEQNSSNNTLTLRLAYLTFQNIIPGFSFEASVASTPDNKNLINQILSTFVYSDNQNSTITSQKAVEIVSNIVEVKTFLTQTPKAMVDVVEIDSTDEYWVVQVFESFPDHNVTHLWYNVDKVTGIATKKI